jgi:ligand-binding sensor domain-containing protein
MLREFQNSVACCLFVYCSLCIISNTAAQYNEADFVRYTVKDGLSHNYINCLQQDDNGYMWIGTDIGLNRFDGYSFKKFYQGSANLRLPSSKIVKLKLFNKRLGIISRGGFQVLNTKDLTATDYFIPDSTSFITYRNAVWDAVQLPDNSFAITTAVGFNVFEQPGKITFRHDAYQPGDIGNKRIFYGRNIFRVTDAEYLVYSEDDKLSLYNSQQKKLRPISGDEKNWAAFQPPGQKGIPGWVVHAAISPNEFIFIYSRKDSIVYYDHIRKKLTRSLLPFSTSKELSWESKIVPLSDTSFAINSGLNGFYLFTLDRVTGNIIGKPEKLLPSYKINCLFLDHEKRVWIGTAKGLLQQRIHKPLLKTYSYYSPTDPSTRGFQCAYRHGSKLYLGRYTRRNGLVIIDTATMKEEKRIVFYSKDDPHNEIISMQMYHPDTLWLGSNAGIVWFDTKSERYGMVLNNKEQKKYNAFIMLAPAGKDGYAWFCSVLNGIAGRYYIPTRKFTFYDENTQPALPFKNVKSITYDAFGDVWIGGHALARWNNSKQQFDTMLQVYGGANKYNDDILVITADTIGSLWLHNVENGLLEYRIKEHRFISYTMKDGLPATALDCFSPIINNKLWIGSANHLTQFDIKKKNALVYDYRDGFPDESPRSRIIYFDAPAHCFYLFCIDYVLKFPEQTSTTTTGDIDLLLQEFSVNNKSSIHHPTDTIRLKYSENNLSLQFATIDFESAYSYRFDYRINNSTWIPLGIQRSINLNELHPGTLHLQLRATAKTGQQQIKELTLIITPPFWKTRWFMLIMAVLLATLALTLFRKRIKGIRKEANINKQLAEYEIKALHAQMNPHFIFNALNSIKEMILEDQKHNASRYLSKFAQLIRMSLDQSRQTFITLQQTIDHLEHYLEMEQLRFADFNYTISVGNNIQPGEIRIAPMLIQPIVENAIWHGLMHRDNGKQLCIRFHTEENRLVCEVEDNGIGINASLKSKSISRAAHRSMGIENIRHRIAVLNEKYKLSYKLDIKDMQEIPGAARTGTIAILSLPIQQ